MDPAGLNVGQAFSELRIDDAALLGCIYVVRGPELGTDADDAVHDLEFDLLAALEACLPSYRWRDHKGRFVFDGDGHDGSRGEMRFRFQCRADGAVSQRFEPLWVRDLGSAVVGQGM